MRCLSGVAAAFVAFWVVAAGADQSSETRFLGSYHHSGGERELQALRDELDRIADKSNVLIRPIVRRKLHQRIKPHFDVHFDKPGSSARLRLGTRAPLVCDGAWQEVAGNGGETGRGVCTFRDGAVVTRSVYGEATLTNSFTLSKDGKELRLDATVMSPQLPEPIRYKMSYRRR